MAYHGLVGNLYIVLGPFFGGWIEFFQGLIFIPRSLHQPRMHLHLAETHVPGQRERWGR